MQVLILFCIILKKIKTKNLYLTSHIRNRQHKLSRAFIVTNKVSSNKLYHLVTSFFLHRTTLYRRVSAKGALSIILRIWYGAAGFPPTTCRSRSGRSTTELSRPLKLFFLISACLFSDLPLFLFLVTTTHNGHDNNVVFR